MPQLLGPLQQTLLSTVPLTSELRGFYRLLLLTSGMVVAVFGLTILLIRILRRYRQTYLASPPKPTPSTDVWQQHRLPEGWEKQIEPDDKDRPAK